MGILDRLKKDKKAKSVLDALIKKKKAEAEVKDGTEDKSSDIEVRELHHADKEPLDDEVTDITKLEEQPIQEFRTEGMHELDIESLGADRHANAKADYKARIISLINQNKIDEAISLLQELREKLSEEK